MCSVPTIDVNHMQGCEAWPRPRGQKTWPRPRGLWPRPRGFWPRPCGFRPRGLLPKPNRM